MVVRAPPPRRVVYQVVCQWHAFYRPGRASTGPGRGHRRPAVRGVAGRDGALGPAAGRRPVRRRSRPRPARAVIDWLSRGEVRPGEPLPLRGTGQAPGDEPDAAGAAVGRLHEQGLVAYHRRLGFSIALPTSGDLHDLFDLRIMCESHALRPAPPLPATSSRRNTAAGPGDLGARRADRPRPRRVPRVLRPRRAAAPGPRRPAGQRRARGLARPAQALRHHLPPRVDGAVRRGGVPHLRPGAPGHRRGAGRGRPTAACARLEAHLLRVRDQTVERLVRAGSIPPGAGYGDRRSPGRAGGECGAPAAEGGAG